MSYRELARHVGHEFECAEYADGANVSLECVTCYEVIVDYEREV